MPLELQIIRAAEFIRLAPDGKFDLAASKAILAELARACRKRGIDRALLDVRSFKPGARPLYSMDDLRALVDTFPEVGFTRQERLAILYHSDPHRRARMFAHLSTARGWTVRAFDSFEKGLIWLSAGMDPAELPSAKPVPVRQITRKRGTPKRKPRRPSQ